MLIVGRLIAGFSIGVLSMIVPLYQAEISYPKHRGLTTGVFQQMIGFGFIVSVPIPSINLQIVLGRLWL